MPPKNGRSLNALGIAYYRLGKYEKALEALRRSDPINKTQSQGSIPGDIAFLAMTHQQLGHAKDAQAELQRLRERMKETRWAQDAQSQGFLHEAEELLATPKTPATELPANHPRRPNLDADEAEERSVSPDQLDKDPVR